MKGTKDLKAPEGIEVSAQRPEKQLQTIEKCSRIQYSLDCETGRFLDYLLSQLQFFMSFVPFMLFLFRRLEIPSTSGVQPRRFQAV